MNEPPPIVTSFADEVAPLTDEPEPYEGVEETAPPPPAPARRAWRRWPVSLGALLLIGVAIWYLQRGSAMPSSSPDGSGDVVQDRSAAAGGGFVSFQSQGVKLGAAGGAAPKIGRAAPEFTLLAPDGGVVRLSDFRGKTVVLNFWATWCAPCRQEFPELVRLYKRNADQGLVVLGVDLQESPAIVRAFTDEFSASFPTAIDRKGDVGSQYRLLGLPTTLFIDTEGVVRAQHTGVLAQKVLRTKLAETSFSMAGNP